MKTILKIAILSMVLISCGSDDNNVPNNNNEPTTFEPHNVEFTLIIKDEGSVSRQNQESVFLNGRQNILFSSASEWELFLEEFSDYELGNFTEINIDFETNQIIVAIDEIKSTGGWSVEITTITEFENEIMTNVVYSDIGNDVQVMTQPYHIVKIPKLDKPVNFSLND